MYSIGKFSKLIGKTTKTLREWDSTGKLKPEYRSKGGHRMYSEKQLNELLGKNNIEKINIGYCRVSSKKQQDDLKRQVNLVENYLSSKGKKYKIIEDIGSGMNYKKKGLLKLIKLIISNEIDTVVVLHKDRLVRFGFDLLSYISSEFNTKIEIINENNEVSDQQKMVDDILNIIHVFSCKLNGKRSDINKKIMNKLDE